MQNFIAMKSTSDATWQKIRQPDAGLSYNFETTYTQDSSRLQSGRLSAKPLFTVEQLGYECGRISVAEMRTILGFIAKGAPFYLRYFSPFTGRWEVGRKFYVGKGELVIGNLSENGEYYDSLSFNMTSVDPLP